ncbi:EamA family transporter [Sphingomonas sp. AAP5]|uniref:EamA family transporter n=1 Tax=Sphingomonas sp. AAP5 TaxID=1523415 RepID=UPI00140550B8|nr:EamA family transporter [Sphingomonas sp. AAP5]
MRPRFILGNIRRGGLFSIAAAALFGTSTPAAKVVVGNVSPLMMAGLLDLGSGLGLTLFRLASGRVRLPFSRSDMPWLAAAVLFGGVLGSALLMLGLTSVTGSAASLLLTMEGVFTALIA